VRRIEGRFEGEPVRADLYLSKVLRLASRSQVKARLSSLLVNGKTAKLSRLLEPGDLVVAEIDEPAIPSFVPEDIPLEVLYEDADAIVVNKRAGMVTHPANGNWSGTLAQALAYRLGMREGQALPLGERGEALRPGIVHRLDKDTSGVIIMAKHPEAQAFLAAQFKERLARKRYLAITRGLPPESEGSVKGPFGRDPSSRKRFAVLESGGKAAHTSYRVLSAKDGYALVLASPHTGRTHQIRVHLRHLGCPILGDPVYGKPDRRLPKAPLMLHAWKLSISLPSGAEPRRFVAPIPEPMREAMRILGLRLDS
jgi:23S rRNA pseudouridine1911/1915/1917 synthase